ncbi:hypothetical protein OCU04_008851 [Sclerotinia nivalis]|uniref:Uncharacterized protein n=1 Tax=Sclerotinia nivalis TaxID=352851 RepID=A0A9X0AH83_9HELO|nr:hypothetical protein OCU04_008851 [Sclerotinia nivalis]
MTSNSSGQSLAREPAAPSLDSQRNQDISQGIIDGLIRARCGREFPQIIKLLDEQPNTTTLKDRQKLCEILHEHRDDQFQKIQTEVARSASLFKEAKEVNGIAKRAEEDISASERAEGEKALSLVALIEASRRHFSINDKKLNLLTLMRAFEAEARVTLANLTRVCETLERGAPPVHAKLLATLGQLPRSVNWPMMQTLVNRRETMFGEILKNQDNFQEFVCTEGYTPFTTRFTEMMREGETSIERRIGRFLPDPEEDKALVGEDSTSSTRGGSPDVKGGSDGNGSEDRDEESDEESDEDDDDNNGKDGEAEEILVQLQIRGELESQFEENAQSDSESDTSIASSKGLAS